MMLETSSGYDNLTAVEAVEAVRCTQPKKSVLILEDRIDRVVRQTLNLNTFKLKGRRGGCE